MMLMLELATKSTVLLAMASFVCWMLHRRSAAMRHLVWSLAFGGLVILPLAALTMPGMRIPVRVHGSGADVLFRAESIAGETAGRGSGGMKIFGSSQPDVSTVLALVWAGGSTIALARIAAGAVAMERLRRESSLSDFGANGIEVRETPEGSMPMAYGLLRPVIFLPSDASDWDSEQLKVVLQHEMAHVKRFDCALHLMAGVALSLFWWNPLAWWARSEACKEQERAADDAVLNEGTSGTKYAEHLLAVARLMAFPQAQEQAVPMASPSHLVDRLSAILAKGLDRSKPAPAMLAASGIMALCLVIPLAAMQATPGASSEAGSNEHIQRGINAILGKDYSRAFSEFELAKAAEAADPCAALMWEGIAKGYLGEEEKADSLLNEATKAGNPDAPETALAMEIYSQFLQHHNRADEAKTLQEGALQIRKRQPPQAATSDAPPSGPAMKIGGEVKAPQLASKEEPEYSDMARAAKYSGTVLMSIVIGTDGKPYDIQILQGIGLELDQKAVEAVSKWRFKPGTKDGEAVNVRANVEVNFRLQ